ncbi:MAG: WecB/TagA/CpsF family glycosyltransferase [Candidatus Cloacimonetes bacterium]|nr:WecB/TagA/CpsF family glycosyltransferase [Candidatus Cloacimonadota bacterium]
MNKIKFLHYPVSNGTRTEFIREILTMSQKNKVYLITVMNANKMYLYDRNLSCAKSVDESTLVLPENAMNIGMILLGTPLKEWDVGGVIIIKELLAQEQLKIFLLGAKNSTLDMIYTNKNFKNIVGMHHGYFEKREIPRIAELINDSKADILVLGLGSPKQELIMQEIKSLLKKCIIIGAGGTIDVLGSVKKHAPRWTRFGLEWIYYAIQDPRKFYRYLIVNTYFVCQLLKYLLFGKRK